MTDLFDRLVALATGGPSLVAARPRARFEPRRAAGTAPAWPAEDQVEVQVSPRSVPPPVGGRTERADPSRCRGPADQASPPVPGAQPAEPTPVPGTGRVAQWSDAPAPPEQPADRTGELRPADPAAPAAAAPAAAAPATVTEVHTIHERDHFHEVAAVERVETTSSVVELIRWIDAGPGDHHDTAGSAGRPVESAADDRPAAMTERSPESTLPPAAQAPDTVLRVAPGTDAEAAPAPTVAEQSLRPVPSPLRAGARLEEVAPAPPAPRITVSIDRLEVRTVSEPKPAPAITAPAGEPVLQFAGPTLEEFLGGRR